MKKSILRVSLALLALAGITPNASAQRYDPRVDVSRMAADDSRLYHNERGNDGRDNSGQGAAELDRLNTEVGRVRILIGDSRSVKQRIRDRYRRAKDATDSLNYQFRRGHMRGWEVRRRAEAIRATLEGIRHDLRGRHISVGGGWR